jgi:hypothetical protein
MQSLMQTHLESINLTLDSQSSKRDEWKRVCSAHKDVKNVKSPREMPWSLPNTIYRALTNKRAVRVMKGLSAH